MSSHGGGVLVIDYGEYVTKGETLVAIRNHKPEHIFQSPGEADVSAWVDFKSLRKALLDSRMSSLSILPTKSLLCERREACYIRKYENVTLQIYEATPQAIIWPLSFTNMVPCTTTNYQSIPYPHAYIFICFF
jgi:Putative S-adenosyl-L-methionine-dependent methyltransferase